METLIFLILKLALAGTGIGRVLTQKNKDKTIMYFSILFLITQIEILVVYLL